MKRQGRKLLSFVLALCMLTCIFPAEGMPVLAEEPAAQTPPQNTYTVASGDCRWSIAQKLYGTGTRWPELDEANRTIIHDPNQIQIGQVLTVPAA